MSINNIYWKRDSRIEMQLNRSRMWTWSLKKKKKVVLTLSLSFFAIKSITPLLTNQPRPCLSIWPCHSNKRCSTSSWQIHCLPITTQDKISLPAYYTPFVILIGPLFVPLVFRGLYQWSKALFANCTQDDQRQMGYLILVIIIILEDGIDCGHWTFRLSGAWGIERVRY